MNKPRDYRLAREPTNYFADTETEMERLSRTVAAGLRITPTARDRAEAGGFAYRGAGRLHWLAGGGGGDLRPPRWPARAAGARAPAASAGGTLLAGGRLACDLLMFWWMEPLMRRDGVGSRRTSLLGGFAYSLLIYAASPQQRVVAMA